MRRQLLALILSVSVLGGCAGLQKAVDALPTVIQYVQDANMILDAIDRAAVPVLAIKGDPDLSNKYAAAMDAARRTLQVALRTAKGGQNLSEDEVDAAFADFRAAYANLKLLLQQNGMMNTAGAMAVSPGQPTIQVQEPLAVSRGGGSP